MIFFPSPSIEIKAKVLASVLTLAGFQDRLLDLVVALIHHLLTLGLAT